MSDDAKVLVSKQLYERLMQDSAILAALEAYGVDNWEGYGDALAEVYGEEEDDEE